MLALAQEFQGTTFRVQTTLKNCSLYESHIPEFLTKAKNLNELLYAVMPSEEKSLVLGQFPAVCL